MGKTNQGFTLIELLVVLGIIGLLAVALLPNILGAGKKGEITETKARLEVLKGIAEQFARKHGYYPPDNFIGVDFKEKPKADTTNPGIESFVIFTHLKNEGGQNLQGNENWLKNTDNDEAGIQITLLNTNKKLEVVDKWGTPFAYFTAASGGYDKAQRIRREDGDEIQARALKDPKTGGYLAPQKYQILSAGPDQVFNTEDDVTYPELPR